MAEIVVPSVFTEFHNEELDLFNSANEEVLRKMVFNNNFLMNLLPVGSIMYIDVNKQGGDGVPDESVWQECNGSEITNPNSPLRSVGIFQRFTPDLRGKYPRGANTLTDNNSGGTHNHNLNHAHGGNTGGGGGGGTGLEDKGDRRHAVFHTHSISSQFNNPTFIEAPAFVYFIAYMKIL